MRRSRPALRAEIGCSYSRQPPRRLRSRTQNAALSDLRRSPTETGQGGRSRSSLGIGDSLQGRSRETTNLLMRPARQGKQWLAAPGSPTVLQFQQQLQVLALCEPCNARDFFRLLTVELH